MDGYGAWFQALFLRDPKCLGVQLKPYSYAHWEVLRKFHSPYLYQQANGDPAPTTRRDLLFAVWVCSRTFKQLQRELFDWRSKLLLNWRTLGRDFAFNDSQMRVYLDDFRRVPRSLKMQHKEPPQPCAAPVSFHITRHLREHEGFTLAESWDCPIGLGRCLFMAWQEAQGEAKLVSEEMEKTEEQDKQRLQLMFAELEKHLTGMPKEQAESLRIAAAQAWGNHGN